jgi:hypothetical protein
MRRIPYALALLAALAVGGPAHAAGCPLIADAAGDAAYPRGPVYGPNVDRLDIRGVDLASGRTTVAVAVHVASLVPDAVSQLGQEWAVSWNVGGSPYFVLAQSVARAPDTFLGYFGTNSADRSVALAVDRATSTLTWTIPRSSLPALETKHATFTGISAVSVQDAGPVRQALDVAGDGTATYEDRSTGCIPAA